MKKIIITENFLRKIIKKKIYTNEATTVNNSLMSIFSEIGENFSDILGNSKNILNIKNNLTKNVDVDKNVSGGGSSKNWGDTPEKQLKTKAAWNYLRPFLPKDTQLTSVFRSQESQDNIIRKYAKKKGWTGAEDLDKMHKFIQDKGMVVTRKVGRGHGGVDGTCAFDLSGANLNDIYKAVAFVSEHPEISKFVKFAKTGLGKGKSSIIERENNAVHAHFYLKDIKTPYDPNFANNVIKNAEASLENKSDEKGLENKNTDKNKGYRIDYRGKYKIDNSEFHKVVLTQLPYGKPTGYFIDIKFQNIYKRIKSGKAKIGDTIAKSTDTKIHPELISAIKSDINNKNSNKSKKS